MSAQAVNPREERVLLLLPAGGADDPEARVIRLALAEAGVGVEPCADFDALADGIVAGAGAALVAEDALTPESVPTLKQIMSSLPSWSDVPLLVLDSGAKGLGSYLAGELSCVTLVDRPVRPASLVTAVMAALR